MGCTSSVPNTSTTNANFTDKCIQYEEEYIETSRSISPPNTTQMINENDSNVLPMCDNLAEPLHLVRSHKSLADFVGSIHEFDNGPLEHENIQSQNNKDIIEEDKISKLEEVIEKVIELYETDKNKVQENDDKSITKVEPLVSSDKQDKDGVINENEIDKEIKETEKKDDIKDEIMSPTQSESSRVTRWEALADIAAELPASLTIDPLTGQIYALSK